MLARPGGNAKQFVAAFDKWRSRSLYFFFPEEELLILFFFCCWFSGATQIESEISLCGRTSFA